MPRQVFTDADQSGQLVDAGQESRESLFLRCNLDGATFLGDWRGSDYLSCTGATDWRQADIYGSYWRGNTLGGSQFPASIGYLHHEPVAEIISQRAKAVLSGATRRTVLQVAQFVASGDYVAASWDTSTPLWWAGIGDRKRREMLAGFRLVFEPYPGLAERFEELVIALEQGSPLFAGDTPLVQTVTWPDGAEVVIDALNLPPLPDPSRYTLARYLEGQAGPGHHLFLYGILPPRPVVLPEPGVWLEHQRGGY